MTNEQKQVVQSKLNDNYVILGFTKSLLNGLSSVCLTKGRHTVVINSLGYDEHFKGKTWKLEIWKVGLYDELL